MTTQEKIDALEAQLPFAGMQIEEGGRKTTYPPLNQIMKEIRILKSQLNGGGVMKINPMKTINTR